MRSQVLEDYLTEKYPSKKIDFLINDFVEINYKPYGKKENKIFRGYIIKIKNKFHLTSITVRSKSDDLHKTVELSLPFYREDVSFKLHSRKFTKKKNQ